MHLHPVSGWIGTPKNQNRRNPIRVLRGKSSKIPVLFIFKIFFVCKEPRIFWFCGGRGGVAWASCVHTPRPPTTAGHFIFDYSGDHRLRIALFRCQLRIAADFPNDLSFRSFISSELAQGSNRIVLLFFGCRHREADFFFRDEWEAAVNSSSSSLTIITAFSRDQGDKVYVQHRIQEQAARVAQLVLSAGACFFVAGNSKQMPTAVRAALAACLTAELEGGEAAAASYVDAMEANGRYQTETWS